MVLKIQFILISQMRTLRPRERDTLPEVPELVGSTPETRTHPLLAGR